MIVNEAQKTAIMVDDAAEEMEENSPNTGLGTARSVGDGGSRDLNNQVNAQVMAERDTGDGVLKKEAV